MKREALGGWEKKEMGEAHSGREKKDR